MTSRLEGQWVQSHYKSYDSKRWDISSLFLLKLDILSDAIQSD